MSTNHSTDIDENEVICTVCAYPEDSFACKIRHIQVNTGAAKAAKDFS